MISTPSKLAYFQPFVPSSRIREKWRIFEISAVLNSAFTIIKI